MLGDMQRYSFDIFTHVVRFEIFIFIACFDRKFLTVFENTIYGQFNLARTRICELHNQKYCFL